MEVTIKTINFGVIELKKHRENNFRFGLPRLFGNGTWDYIIISKTPPDTWKFFWPDRYGQECDDFLNEVVFGPFGYEFDSSSISLDRLGLTINGCNFDNALGVAIDLLFFHLRAIENENRN
jgi:hypothetical protein